MNPAYKNWSKEEIIRDNLGKKIVVSGVNDFGTPISDDDTLCFLYDDGRVATEFGVLVPLNQISLVNVVYKNEDFIYGVSFSEEFPPEARKRIKTNQDFINYAYQNGFMLDIYDGSYREISDVNDEGFFIDFEDSLNDKNYFKFNEIQLLDINESNQKERSMDIEEKVKELNDKIADLQLANESLDKRLKGMSKAMKVVLDFLINNNFQCEERTPGCTGSAYNVTKSLEAGIGNEFLNNTYRGE